MGRYYDEYIGARVETVVRMLNSVNGNPRYKMVISAPVLTTVRTDVDSAFAYDVKNLNEGDLVDVKVTAGGIIVGLVREYDR